MTVMGDVVNIKSLKAEASSQKLSPAFKLTQNTPRQNQPPSNQPLPEATPVTPLPSPDELLQPPKTNPEQTPPSDVPETITVERFEVMGSTVFFPGDFAKVTEPYTQRPISLAELFQVRSLITQLYLDHGYITSGAYIPPQKLQGGTVKIQIVEGGLEGIKVRGTRRLNPNYIRSRLALVTGKPLKRDRLLRGLQLLQLNPLVANISAELAAGTEVGESVLEVTVREAKSFDVTLSADNGRSPSVGSFRRQLQVSQGNLFGLGDGLNVSYTNTDGSNAFDLSYSLPLNPRNGTLAVSYGTSSSNVIEQPFSVLDIQSESRYYELTLRQPLMQTPTQEFAVGITATRRESEASFLNGEIPFPASGADKQGRTRISALRFFQEWTQRNNREVLAGRSQFSIGLDALNSTINNTAPDSRFYAWRGQGQWVRLLAPDTFILLRGDIQFSDRPLPPFEQFGIGGIESVRGYRQDALLTDNGIFASAEVRLPIARFSPGSNLLQLTPFIDFGTVWNRQGRPNSAGELKNDTLLSVGLGLRWQLEDHLTARLEWGIPLIDIGGERNSWQDNGIYFSIVGHPF